MTKNKTKDNFKHIMSYTMGKKNNFLTTFSSLYFLIDLMRFFKIHRNFKNMINYFNKRFLAHSVKWNLLKIIFWAIFGHHGTVSRSHTKGWSKIFFGDFWTVLVRNVFFMVQKDSTPKISVKFR
jgi:hypothetical protein